MKRTADSGSCTQGSFTVSRHVKYKFRRFRFSALFMVMVGLALIVESPFIDSPFLAAGGIAAIAMPLPLFLPPFTRIHILDDSDQVLVRRTASPFTLWAIVFPLTSIAVFIQIFVGATHAGRLVIPAIFLLVGGIISGIQARKTRGSFTLGPDSVGFWNGITFVISRMEMSYELVPDGVPLIRLTQQPGSDGRRIRGVIQPPCYGIDFDTLYSTLEQLQVWSRAGHVATAQQIKWMLKVKPPKRLAVGESVEIPIQ